jgi:threonine/homoserine/homoserine lactone efflux protein
MAVLGQGIYAGLLLALLVGPLLVALLQASLERGTKAAMMVAIGIWMSDLLFVLAVYFGMSQLHKIVGWSGFELSLGLVGAVVLAIVGIATLVTPPPSLTANSNLLAGAKDHTALLLKGFFINTLNPFTVFFWVTIMTGVVLKNSYDTTHATLYFSGILGTIVVTDSLKVLLAKKIRHKLTSNHLWWVRRVAGVALLLFALALVVRVTW